MSNHRIQIPVYGRMVDTLEDILPEEGKPLKVLFIAKVPTPGSVEAGHYFQGNHGKIFWRMFKECGILVAPDDEYEDDYLIEKGCGFIDIVKAPREYGDEPKGFEYEEGTQKAIKIIKEYQPKVLVFIYKKVIDEFMKYHFQIKYKSKYGFNSELEKLFGCMVFGFPMPGTPCRSTDAQRHMSELKEYLSTI